MLPAAHYIDSPEVSFTPPMSPPPLLPATSELTINTPAGRKLLQPNTPQLPQLPQLPQFASLTRQGAGQELVPAQQGRGSQGQGQDRSNPGLRLGQRRGDGQEDQVNPGEVASLGSSHGCDYSSMPTLW